MRLRIASALLLVSLSIVAFGCKSQRPDGLATVTGRLVSIKDDRPLDGGVDLTVDTGGASQKLRVGSAYIAGPREHIVALHRVVDAAKIGDRLRARGKRDQDGALAVEYLLILN